MGAGDLDALEPEVAILVRPHKSPEIVAKLLRVANINGVSGEVCQDRYGLAFDSVPCGHGRSLK